ncbi:hypothetical protein PIB30_018714 [Stylosanthes scabra]|uniref:Uncharacterized protein n=1 Tax=Stylosanthes scabra TaxID=79078 RepID=A0ABU6X696_9FABA|nr:hypothetical protein [Stylosanthes scabra]
MARPHASHSRGMTLARPRGELGHIRQKLPSSMAPPRPPLSAPAPPARWPWCVRAVARVTLGRNSAIRARPRASGHDNDNGANSDDEHTKDWISSGLYTCAQRTVPSSSVGRANAKDNNSGLF